LGNLIKKNTFQENDNNLRKNKKVFPSLKSVKENEMDSFDDVDMKRLGTDDESADKDSV